MSDKIKFVKIPQDEINQITAVCKWVCKHAHDPMGSAQRLNLSKGLKIPLQDGCTVKVVF